MHGPQNVKLIKIRFREVNLTECLLVSVLRLTENRLERFVVA